MEYTFAGLCHPLPLVKFLWCTVHYNLVYELILGGSKLWSYFWLLVDQSTQNYVYRYGNDCNLQF